MSGICRELHIDEVALLGQLAINLNDGDGDSERKISYDDFVATDVFGGSSSSSPVKRHVFANEGLAGHEIVPQPGKVFACSPCCICV